MAFRSGDTTERLGIGHAAVRESDRANRFSRNNGTGAPCTLRLKNRGGDRQVKAEEIALYRYAPATIKQAR